MTFLPLPKPSRFNCAAPPIEDPTATADFWEQWCGETAWSRSLREFGALGGKIRYWCGVPRSASAIPLTFELFAPDGRKLDKDGNRLKDIRAAIKQLEAQP